MMMFYQIAKQDIDCDASAILLQDGKFVSKYDLVYFGNLNHRSGSVNHQGDNLTGAGATGDSSLDAGNLLKPYLASGKIRFIGATTFEEYKKYFEITSSLKNGCSIKTNPPTTTLE